MTDAETIWTLKRANANLRMALCESQVALLTRNHADAKAELDALGEKYVDPEQESLKAVS